MAWTEERIKELRQLWSEGQSASKIAEKVLSEASESMLKDAINEVKSSMLAA